MIDFTKKMPWGTDELVRLYRDTGSGHYFDKDTMRFFRSRVTGNFRRISDKEALFITTERGPCADSKRLATIRRARIVDYKREGGDLVSRVEIETVGEFNSLTLPRAKRIMASV